MLDPRDIPGARPSSFPAKLVPMLASLPEFSFDRSGWIFEPKMDGMRALAMVSNGVCKLMSRRALDITKQYPALTAELPSLLSCDAVLDGEIIALNEIGRPSFQHLQQRMNLTRVADIARAESAVPAYYFVFDVVYANGYDLSCANCRTENLFSEKILTQSDKVRQITYFETDGMAAYEVCVDNGFEGVVSKRLDSFYEPGRRSPSWIKVKAQQTDEFVVGGFTKGQGTRSPTFGALLLGAYDEQGRFIYCGSVGTGFDERLLHETVRRVEPHKQPKHPFLKRPDEKKEVVWLAPHVVIEIKFMDWTRDGHLRSPVFLRFRDDIEPAQVALQKRKPTEIILANAPLPEIPKVAEGENRYLADEQAPPRTVKKAKSREPARFKRPAKQANRSVPNGAEIAAQLAAGKDDKSEIVVDGDVVEFSHLNRFMWPAFDNLPKLSKRDFLRYIASAAPSLLGFIKDRPLSVVRSPDGINGKRFYQKHWNFPVPDFVETIFLNEESELAMCNNFASLLWFAQHSVMEYHVWLSRVTARDAEGQELPEAANLHDGTSDGESPDFMVFDLDCHAADENKAKSVYRQEFYLQVCQAAEWLRDALVSAGLTPYLKTSGRNGLHIFVPIENTLAHDEVRFLAETISKFIASKHTNEVCVDPIVAKREGKVLLDCSPNCKGKTLVAPYSPRLVPEQTVSAPLRWDELGKVFPIELTMESMPSRIAATGDLWHDWPEKRGHLDELLHKKKSQ